MAAKAAVLIDLTATDASPQLDATAAAARGAADALGSTEDATKAARAELRAIAKESALSERAFRDLAKAADLIGTDAAAGLVTVAHGSERTRKALDRLEAQAKQTDRAMDGIGKRVGDVGGDLARFGGQMDVLGDAGRPITLLGDAIELLSSPLGATVAALATMGAAIGAAVVAIKSVDESTERLRELGRQSQLTASDLTAIGLASDALDAVEASALRLGQTFAAESAPGVEAMATSTAHLLSSLDPLIGTVGRYTGSLAKGTATALAFVEVMREATAEIPLYVDVLSFGSAPLYEMIAALDQVIPRAVQNSKALEEMGQDAEWASVQYAKLVKELDKEREMLQALGIIETDAEGAARDADVKARASAAEAAAKAKLADALREIETIQAGATPALEGLDATFAEIDALDRLSAAHLSSVDVQVAVAAARSAILAKSEREAEAAHIEQMGRIQEESAAHRAALLALASLPSSSQLASDAMRAARQATMQSVAGGVQGLAGVAGGNIGGALALAGPGGMIAATLVELGPDSAEMLDERLEAIGENIIKLPETLAKLLATLVGFGADSKGEGIGRALGFALGVGAAVALPGVGLVAGAGIAAGSAAAGGAVGSSLSREERRDRRDRRRRPQVIVNGIATAEAVRTLDGLARKDGGPRGRRFRLDRE